MPTGAYDRLTKQNPRHTRPSTIHPWSLLIPPLRCHCSTPMALSLPRSFPLLPTCPKSSSNPYYVGRTRSCPHPCLRHALRSPSHQCSILFCQLTHACITSARAALRSLGVVTTVCRRRTGSYCVRTRIRRVIVAQEAEQDVRVGGRVGAACKQAVLARSACRLELVK